MPAGRGTGAVGHTPGRRLSDCAAAGRKSDCRQDPRGVLHWPGASPRRSPRAPSPFGDFGAKPEVDDLQRIEAWGDARAAGLPRAGDRSALTASSSPTSCATCWAPSASRPSASQLRKRGYTRRLHRRRARQPARAPDSSARARPCASSRSATTSSRAHGGGYNAQKRAFDTVGAGEVLVIEARGERGSGTRRRRPRAARAGARRGRHRHRRRRARLRRGRRGRHPDVLARARTPRCSAAGTCRGRSTSTIACGGTTVQPGDVIVGDGDGVIVIPPRPRRGGRRRGARAGGRGRVGRRAGRGRGIRRRAVPDERRVAGALRGARARTDEREP